MSHQNRKIIINHKVYQVENLNTLLENESTEASWPGLVYAFLQNWFDDSDVIITHTSGSTGQPKKIKLSKQAMRNSAAMTNSFFGLGAGKTALLCLPASYIAGKMMLVRAIVGRFNLICMEPEANPFQKISDKIDFAAITPYQLNYSLETLKTYPVENIIVGGSTVNAKLEKTCKDIPAALYETYGMTETASHIALRKFNGEKCDYFSILNGVSIRQDERNCLVINAPHLTDEELITNDIVEIKNERNFRWLGRTDSVINSGGVKIFPEQVERKLQTIIDLQFFISSTNDDLLGQKLILVAECTKNELKEIEKIVQHSTSVLSKYEMPKAFFNTEKFIYSIGNKLLRKETLAKVLKADRP